MWKFLNRSGEEKVQDGAYLPVLVPIRDVLLTAPAASVNFPNIPQTFTHLRLMISARDTVAAPLVNGYIQFNGDAGANYDQQDYMAIAAAASLAEGFGSLGMGVQYPGGTAGAGLFGQSDIAIDDYTNPSKNKTAISLSSSKVGIATGNLRARMLAGWWRNSAPITSLQVVAGTSFDINSRFTLYGLSIVPLPSPGSILPVTYGTSLPASPLEGQEAILVDSVAAPTYSWRFRYDPNITGANKWVFVGGAPWSGYGSGNAGAGAVYTDWSSSNPSFTIPRAGTYLIRHGAGFYGTNAGSFFLSVKLGAAATSDGYACRYENAPGTVPISLMRSITVPLAAADIVKLQGKASTGNLASYYNFMEVIPVAVA